MEKHTRRTFMASAATLGLSSAASAIPMTEDKKQLVHHVFFWLKNPSSKEDSNKLVEGLKSLMKIEQLRVGKIGIPAATEKRPVVDHSYSVSWLNIFDDIEGQDQYQVHPLHLKFIEDCKHLWEKVVVYDSMDI